MKKKPVKAPQPPATGSPGWFKQSLLGLYGIVGLGLSTFGGFKVPFAESNAKEYWRHALAGIILVLGLLAGMVSLALYLFNANYFKSQIVEYVKTTTQRDLTLDGDLTVSFFPKLALDAGKMTISQRNSNKSFASIEGGHFHIAWWPLFLKQLQVESVTLDGVHANVTRFKNGTTNLDDFVTSDGNISDIKFEIDSIRLTNSSISLQDEGSGYFVSLHDLNLETGKLANNLPADVTSTFRVDSANPRLDGKVRLSTHLLFDLKAGSYELANMEGTMEGDIAGLSALNLGFQASLKGNTRQEQIEIDKVGLNAKGQLEKRKLDARLDLPGIKFSKGKASGSKLAISGTLLQEEENLGVTLEIPAFSVEGNVLKSDTTDGSINFFKSGRTLQGKFSSPLNADFGKHTLDFPGINGNFSLTHPAINGKLTGPLTGGLTIATDEPGVKLKLRSKVDDSNLTGSFAVQNFAKPDFAFELIADKIDLDRYLVTDWSKRLQDKAQPFDFAALKDITLHGKFHANDLKFAKLKANNVHGETSIESSKLTLDVSSARMYGGNASILLAIDTKESGAFSLRQKLGNVQLNTLLADLTGNDSKLTGKGSLNWDVTGNGDNLAALYQSLNGTASLNLGRGTLAGLDLPASLLANKARLGTADETLQIPAKFSDTTPFIELKGSFEINGGKARCSDFLLKAPTYTIKGEGENTLATGDLKYSTEVAVPASLKRSDGDMAALRGVTLPLQASGNWNSPLYTLDLGHASGMQVQKPAAPAPAKPVKKATKNPAP